MAMNIDSDGNMTIKVEDLIEDLTRKKRKTFFLELEKLQQAFGISSEQMKPVLAAFDECQGNVVKDGYAHGLTDGVNMGIIMGRREAMNEVNDKVASMALSMAPKTVMQ